MSADHVERMMHAGWSAEYIVCGSRHPQVVVSVHPKAKRDFISITIDTAAADVPGIHAILLKPNASLHLELADEFVYVRPGCLNALYEWERLKVATSVPVPYCADSTTFVATGVMRFKADAAFESAAVARVELAEGVELHATDVTAGDDFGCRRYYAIGGSNGRRLALFKYVWAFAGGDVGAQLLDLGTFVALPTHADEGAAAEGGSGDERCAACSAQSGAQLVWLHGHQWHGECHTRHCWRCRDALVPPRLPLETNEHSAVMSAPASADVCELTATVMERRTQEPPAAASAKRTLQDHVHTGTERQQEDCSPMHTAAKRRREDEPTQFLVLEPETPSPRPTSEFNSREFAPNFDTELESMLASSPEWTVALLDVSRLDLPLD